MNIKNALGGLVGSTPSQNPFGDMWASQTTTLPLTGINNTLSGAQYAGHNINELERMIAQKERSNMVEVGDLIVRKVRNGYKIIVANGPGIRSDEYVAKDLDEVNDVLKLASVNVELDRAK